MPSGNPLGELPSLLSESSGIYYGILPHVTYIQTTRSGDRSNKINVPYKHDNQDSLASFALLKV